MLAQDAAKLTTLPYVFPDPVAAVLAVPYVILNEGLSQTEKAVVVAKAEKLASMGVTEKVILRS